MSLEDRLIQEKSLNEQKREEMRRDKEQLEISVLKDRPQIGDTSANMGYAKNQSMRVNKGLSKSMQKHEELYLDYQKKQTKIDLRDDDIKLKQN